MKLKQVVMGVLVMGPLFLANPVRAELCDVNDPRLLKPDLIALPPSRVRVLQRSGVRRVIFATKIGNVGKGPLIIHGNTVNTPSGPVTQATQVIRRNDGSECDYPSGSFEFHASHNHFHLNDFSTYELRSGAPLTGPLVAKADKVSFCIADLEALRGTNTQRQVLAQCGVQEGVQGLSVGWADVYDNYLPEQWVDVPADVPAGYYFLSNVADPDDLLLEENEGIEANTGTSSVSVPIVIGGAGVPPTATATLGSAQPTPTATVRGPVRPPRPPRPPRAPRPARPTPIRVPR